MPDNDAKPAKADPKAKSENETKSEESTEGLVKVTKAGETLHVHPTTVQAHEAAGWKLA